MARPKETYKQKVLKVYPDARCERYNNSGNILWHYVFQDKAQDKQCLSMSESETQAWADALTQIRKDKIKAAKDKRKQSQPVKVKEIKKHVGLTMYPTDKAYIIERFKSVQKFLDFSIEQVKLANTIKTK